MPILSISFKNFRNLNEASSPVSFSETINVITGENAAGKTSLLEALYMLTTARSFRTRLYSAVAKHDNDDKTFLVSGCIGSHTTFRDSLAEPPPVIGGAIINGHNEYFRKTHIGILKSHEQTQIRVQGENVKVASSLAILQPILLFEPSSFDLLTGNPGERRRFLDWGVFHVEHRFISVWSEYQRCLKQRNSLLRSDKMDPVQLDIWEDKLGALSETVDEFRRSYFNAFEESFAHYIGRFGLTQSMKISYYRGWLKDEPFARALKNSRERDRNLKFTQSGPHRADFKITLEGRAAKDVLSRGQLKLATLALFLAHIEQMANIKKNTVFLIDDISSELDKVNIANAIHQLRSLQSQVFLTSLSNDVLTGIYSGDNDLYSCKRFKTFHVERGEIKETSNQDCFLN